jgi:hypothetical protein
LLIDLLNLVDLFPVQIMHKEWMGKGTWWVVVLVMDELLTGLFALTNKQNLTMKPFFKYTAYKVHWIFLMEPLRNICIHINIFRGESDISVSASRFLWDLCSLKKKFVCNAIRCR